MPSAQRHEIYRASVIHSPQREEGLGKGWIYSQLFNNNFGTNFSVSQCGEALFRYVLATASDDVPDAEAPRFGWHAVTPIEQILTDRAHADSNLAPCGSFLSIDNDAVVLVACKMAEDCRGTIVRLWNMSGAAEKARLTFPLAGNLEAVLMNLCEEDTCQTLACDGDGVAVEIAARDQCTLRIIGL